MELIVIFLAYLAGSIPFGLVIGKCTGIDVRNSGSGNIGATNVSRLLGKKLGAMTLVADAAKAVLPMVLVALLCKERPDLDLLVALAGGAAFLGHLYPIYLRFRGGKGVATALGVFLYLNPLSIVLVAASFVAVVRIWGYVSLGSLVASALLPVVIFALGGPLVQLWLALFIAVLIWIKHHENIGRLVRGEENSWKKK